MYLPHYITGAIIILEETLLRPQKKKKNSNQ